MTKRSAGLLLFRGGGERGIEVLLVHPGGPFWARRDEGAWSIPKGEIEPGEDALAAARREFGEEIGSPAPDGPFIPLGQAVQPSRKIVTAFAVDSPFDPDTLDGSRVEIEWPPRSGRRRSFPEVDRAGWFDPAAARGKILRGQAVFLDRLAAALRTPEPG